MSEETQSDNVNDKKPKQTLSSLKVLLVGSVSGTISAIFLQPFNVIKTRLQNPRISLKDNKYNRHRIISLLSHIRKHEHVSVLWAGTVPTIMRSIPGGGIYFYVYDTIKKKFYSTRTPNSMESLTMGMVTRAVTDISVIPLTVVKTRVESGIYKYNGVINAIRDIYRNEGIRGLTSGLIPLLIRDCPMSGIYVMFYNQTQSLIPQDFSHEHPSTVHSSCAAISVVLASILTHPPDVLKTQMQLFPGKYPSLRSVASTIYIKHGIQGYFQGIIPRLLKRTVFAAISWPLYEKVALQNTDEKKTYPLKYE